MIRYLDLATAFYEGVAWEKLTDEEREAFTAYDDLRQRNNWTFGSHAYYENGEWKSHSTAASGR